MIQSHLMVRLYVTTSLFSSWDNQFYPKMNESGGMMLIVDCDNEKGGMKIRDNFLIDFEKNQMVLLELMKQDIPAVIAHLIFGFKLIY